MTLMEPFCRRSRIHQFSRWLGYHFTYSNCNNKIWLLCDQRWDCAVLQDTKQQLTCCISDQEETFIVTVVYAKCKQHQRESLWEDLRNMAQNITLPWIIAGDFNCILEPREKKGENAHRMTDNMPFLNCIFDCSLIDAGYIGSIFTWYNGRSQRKRVWKRLDRVLMNYDWTHRFVNTTITHLVRTGFDHSPLLITIASPQPSIQTYFRFLDFWTTEPKFNEVVKQAWDEEVT